MSNNKEENGKGRIYGETAEKNGGSEIIRKIVHFIRRSSEDVKSPEQQRITRVLLENIDKYGLIDINRAISKHEEMYGRSVIPLESGFESNVYLFKNDKNRVIKVTNWQATNGVSNTYKLNPTIADFVQNKVVAQNQLFPETPYEILGVTADLKFVLEQPYIEPLREVHGKSTISAIEKDLVEDGYKKFAGKFGKFHVFWIDKESQYIVFDLRPANVLLGSDRELYYIDPIIQADTEIFRRVAGIKNEHPKNFTN